MQLPVRSERSKARRVATLPVPAGDDVMKAIERLRSWALTKDIRLDSPLSWTIGVASDGEARCPIPEKVEVHPEVGISVRRIPSGRNAVVEVSDPGLTPEKVAGPLQAWALDRGYSIAGPAEVFLRAVGETGFIISIPVQRRALQNFIEI